MDDTFYCLFTLINSVISLLNLRFFAVLVRKTKSLEHEFREMAITNVTKEKDNNSSSNSVITDKEEQKRTELFISPLTKDRLLKDFEKIHQSKFFLKRRVSLNNLAELLGTNQRYASYILKDYIGLDFNGYLQQERINYLIESVEQNPELLNLKFSVLAEKAGFSSVSKFSTFFKAVKGISPSEYFQKMR